MFRLCKQALHHPTLYARKHPKTQRSVLRNHHLCDRRVQYSSVRCPSAPPVHHRDHIVAGNSCRSDHIQKNVGVWSLSHAALVRGRFPRVPACAQSAWLTQSRPFFRSRHNVKSWRPPPNFSRAERGYPGLLRIYALKFYSAFSGIVYQQSPASSSTC